jgi:hypothetical protein
VSLSGGSGQQAKIGAAQGLPTLEQLEPGSRQHPADSQAQAVDFFGKQLGTDGLGQKRFDELQKKSGNWGIALSYFPRPS